MGNRIGSLGTGLEMGIVYMQHSDVALLVKQQSSGLGRARHSLKVISLSVITHASWVCTHVNYAVDIGPAFARRWTGAQE